MTDFVIADSVLRHYIGASAVVTVPTGVTTIGISAFYRTDATSVTIPEGVTEIRTFAFMGCAELARVELPSTLVRIDAGAFAMCAHLTDMVLPESVKELGDNVFQGCNGLAVSMHAALCNGRSAQEILPAACGYLARHAVYPYTAEDHAFFSAYIKSHSSDLLPRILERMDTLRGFLRLGLLNARDYDCLLEQVSALADVELNALLLAWSNAHRPRFL